MLSSTYSTRPAWPSYGRAATQLLSRGVCAWRMHMLMHMHGKCMAHAGTGLARRQGDGVGARLWWASAQRRRPVARCVPASHTTQPGRPARFALAVRSLVRFKFRANSHMRNHKLVNRAQTTNSEKLARGKTQREQIGERAETMD